MEPRLPEFQASDLPRLLLAFARASVRDEPRAALVGRELLARGVAEMAAPTVATSLFSLALLDCDAEGALVAAELTASAAPRRLSDFSPAELVRIAFALVILDLHRA